MLSQVRHHARGVARKIRHVPPASTVDPGVKATANTTQNRHPAMRGINVSPVHGHHCNCSRCLPQAGRDAA
jgi:hypothetical protein